MLNALNQNTDDFKLNFSSFMSSKFGTNVGNNNNSNVYYAKKGEPTYQKDMDEDDDGVVTFEEFKNYCKANGISSQEMSKMLEMRMAYQMSKDTTESSKENKKTEMFKPSVGSLDIIYAQDGDDKYDSDMDTNGDSKISYKEYLRYCEQNARTEEKRSDTHVSHNDKNQFMTTSFGRAANAYFKNEGNAPEGKVVSKA